MKKIAFFAVALMAVALASGLAQATPQTKPQPAAQVPAEVKEAKDALVRAYRIGPGDLLELKVFEVKELDQTVRVSEDGSITIPLLGRVMVEGLTQEGVVQKLTELLQAKYVKNPQVTIFIKEYKNQQVAVIGAVENAGSYELVGRKNLLQIISMAGGFSETAGNEVFILREGSDGATSTVSIDLKDLSSTATKLSTYPSSRTTSSTSRSTRRSGSSSWAGSRGRGRSRPSFRRASRSSRRSPTRAGWPRAPRRAPSPSRARTRRGKSIRSGST